MDVDKMGALPRATTLVMLSKRILALCDITVTLPQDWFVDFGQHGLATCYHQESGAYITICGGGPDGEEHMLDTPGLTTTAERRKKLADGGGALAYLLIRERKRMLADRATRAARASAKKEQ